MRRILFGMTMVFFSIGCNHIATQTPGVATGKLTSKVEVPEDNARARLFLAEGKCDTAELELREAVKNRPDDCQAQLLLGYALARQGKAAQAETAFRRTLELTAPDDPARLSALLGLGATLEREGRAKEANEIYARAMQMDPTLEKTLESVEKQRLWPDSVVSEDYIRGKH